MNFCVYSPEASIKSTTASFFDTSFSYINLQHKMLLLLLFFLLKLPLSATGAIVFCFLSSLPLLPPPPRQCLGTTCGISLLLTNTVSPDSGLPNGRGFVRPKEMTIVDLLVFNPLCLAGSHHQCLLRPNPKKNISYKTLCRSLL
jgi:hypothetical protein